jgi:hypothetical protein
MRTASAHWAGKDATAKRRSEPPDLTQHHGQLLDTWIPFERRREYGTDSCCSTISGFIVRNPAGCEAGRSERMLNES